LNGGNTGNGGTSVSCVSCHGNGFFGIPKRFFRQCFRVSTISAFPRGGIPMKFVSRTGGVYELLRASASIDITEVLGTEAGEKVDCVFHDEDDIPDLHVYEDHAH
jgi:hypothetical protein